MEAYLRSNIFTSPVSDHQGQVGRPIQLDLRLLTSLASDFGWRWLGKGKNREEQNNSDEDKNPMHKRKSWSEVVRGLLVKVEELNNSNPGFTTVAHDTRTYIQGEANYSGKEVLTLLSTAKGVRGQGSER